MTVLPVTRCPPSVTRYRPPRAGSSLQLEPEGLCISGRCDCSTGYRLPKPQGSGYKPEPAKGRCYSPHIARHALLATAPLRVPPPAGSRLPHPWVLTHPLRVQVCNLNLKVYVFLGVVAVQSGIARSNPKVQVTNLNPPMCETSDVVTRHPPPANRHSPPITYPVFPVSFSGGLRG